MPLIGILVLHLIPLFSVASIEVESASSQPLVLDIYASDPSEEGPVDFIRKEFLVNGVLRISDCESTGGTVPEILCDDPFVELGREETKAILVYLKQRESEESRYKRFKKNLCSVVGVVIGLGLGKVSADMVQKRAAVKGLSGGLRKTALRTILTFLPVALVVGGGAYYGCGKIDRRFSRNPDRKSFKAAKATFSRQIEVEIEEDIDKFRSRLVRALRKAADVGLIDSWYDWSRKY